MPTRNRRRFAELAVRWFLRQDYPARELVVLDDGDDGLEAALPDDARVRYHRVEARLTLGAKRNLAVRLAHGELIAHWDDDDWMAPDRLSRQVAALGASGADACGARSLLHYHLSAGEAWLYRYPAEAKPWLVGGTLLYRRAAWEAAPFPEDTHVGEDTAFVWRLDPARLHAMEGEPFYVAVVHGANTSAKRLGGRHWERRPLSEVAALLGPDQRAYASLRAAAPGRARPAPRLRAVPASPPPAAVKTTAEPPLVSCIMPTADRPVFAERAVEYFLRQDHPRRELVIVDDGREPVAHLAARDPRIRYLRAPRRMSIGAKRNLACEVASGEVIACWDDDDWYADDRLSVQVAPIAAGLADATALDRAVLLQLPGCRFWACGPRHRDQMFFHGVVGGTVAFLKRRWGGGVRFPDRSLAEDAAFLRALLARGARVQRLAGEGRFLYVRHGANSWRFEPGAHQGQGDAWREVATPAFIPPADLAFYAGLGAPQAEAA
ncbi:MAG TPA: glycosyltransferase family 2 protein [Longimicrobium sp.]